MDHTISVIETGGTFSMGKDATGALVPYYSIIHAALAATISQSSLSEDAKQSCYDALVNTVRSGKDAANPHHAIQPALALFNRNNQSEYSPDDILQQYGVRGEAIRPYFIDSINFSFEEHYALLQQSIINSLEGNAHLLVIGGTDTLEFYAQAIARDPAIHQHLSTHPDANITFVSSMRSFSENPAHNAKIFANAVAFSNQAAPGIFTLSAKDESVSAMTAHDLQHAVSKISSMLPDAFKSNVPYATINKNQHIDFQSPPTPIRAAAFHESKPLNDVAPPLIRNNTTQAIIAYLDAFPDAAVLMEGGIPMVTNALSTPQDRHALINAVHERALRGVATYFVNDITYCAQRQAMQPLLDEQHWQDSKFLRQIRDAGGSVVSDATIIATYLDALFETTPPAINPSFTPQHLPKHHKKPPSIDAIGIKYIPNEAMFERGLHASAEITDNLIISALPAGAIPERHLPSVNALSNDGKHAIYSGFKYSGNKYTLDAAPFIEGTHASSYAAGQALADSGMQPLGEKPPSDMMRSFNHEAKARAS